MTEIISVRFRSGGKQYYFDPNGTQFQEGQGVIVETGKPEQVISNPQHDRTKLFLKRFSEN